MFPGGPSGRLPPDPVPVALGPEGSVVVVATVDVLASVVVGPADKVVVLRGDAEVFRVVVGMLPPGSAGIRLDVVAPRPEPLSSPRPEPSRPALDAPDGEAPGNVAPAPGGAPAPDDGGATTRVERLTRGLTKGKD